MRKRIFDYILMLLAFVLVALVGLVAFMQSRDNSRASAEFVVHKSTAPTVDQAPASLKLSAAADQMDNKTEISQKSESSESTEKPSSESQDLRKVFDPAVAFGLESQEGQTPTQTTAARAALPAVVKQTETAAATETITATEAVTIAAAPRQTYIQQVSETINVPFETEYQETDLLAQGEQKLMRQGYDAVIEIDYEQIFENGILVETREVGRRYLASGQSHIILVGTGQAAVPETTPIPESSPDPEPTQPIYEEPEIIEEDVYAPQNTPLQSPVQDSGQAAAMADFTFTSPGSVSAAETNFSVVSGLLNRNGAQTYTSFNDNGNGTITVDGYTFAVANGPLVFTTTSYDGYECYKLYPDPGAVNECNRTASGILAQRGIVASSQLSGGYPMGTVLFIEGYGLGVVADRHGMGDGLLDLSFDAREISQGVFLPTGSRQVYVLQ
ncbi:MAG: G5 domain-containing protein [Eubacteriales bacterium]|nr:G5 domain-containing protein [Eubacteriales bacterium]